MQGKEYVIGRTKLILPEDHALERYQARWKRYDRALGEIARLIEAKYPDFRAIDIGANVGDSAAVISTYDNVETLCIEGTESFLPYLRENARRMGPHIKIEVAFVGDETPEGYGVKLNEVGSAKLVADGSAAGVKVRSLASLLAAAPDFARPRLLKIDTDGFDFQIITASKALLADIKPVVFYEYAPFEQPNGVADGLQSYQSLVEAGYRFFMVYDNFGNFLVHLTADDFARFVDLNGYLCSNQANGVAVYYYDLCAFAEPDLDVFNALRTYELSPYFGQANQPS